MILHEDAYTSSKLGLPTRTGRRRPGSGDPRRRRLSWRRFYRFVSGLIYGPLRYSQNRSPVRGRRERQRTPSDTLVRPMASLARWLLASFSLESRERGSSRRCSLYCYLVSQRATSRRRGRTSPLCLLTTCRAGAASMACRDDSARNPSVGRPRLLFLQRT